MSAFIASTEPTFSLFIPYVLEERLPVIAIPLLPGDPDVSLPLQSVFDQGIRR